MMFTYKNTSLSVKTFYGVTFEPGDEKEVSGFINSPGMIRVLNDKPKAIHSSRGTNKSSESNKSCQSSSNKQFVDKKPTDSVKSEQKGGESENGTDQDQ